MLTTLTARRLLNEDEIIDNPVITIDDGIIVSLVQGPPTDATGTLTCSFFDIHVHGAVGHDFMSAPPAAIDEIGRFMAESGVAHYLPTTVTAPLDTTLRALERLADAIEVPVVPAIRGSAATPVGIHLEGPFVSHAKRGIHPAASILMPDTQLFDRFQQAARGHIRLITLAPEIPGALELIEHASAAGVRVSLGHSDASENETLAACQRGAVSATHIFNAMRALDHREPGILGTVLDNDDTFAELICDGIHVHPALVRLWLKLKGGRRSILVTDGMSATGMPDGTYLLGYIPVQVVGGVCRSGGALAGSVLTMDRAVANLRRFTGASLATAVRLASANPASMLRLPELARIAPGRPANFNFFDTEGAMCGSMLHGELVSAMPSPGVIKLSPVP